MIYLTKIDPINKDGAYGLVRRVGNFVFKSPETENSRVCLDHIRNDFNINYILQSRGASVPKVLGLVDTGETIKVGGIEVHIDVPSFIREFVPGISINDLEGKNYNFAKKLFDQSMDYARSLGFNESADSYGGNAILLPDRSRVVLIDFGSWELRK